MFWVRLQTTFGLESYPLIIPRIYTYYNVYILNMYNFDRSQKFSRTSNRGDLVGLIYNSQKVIIFFFLNNLTHTLVLLLLL